MCVTLSISAEVQLLMGPPATSGGQFEVKEAFFKALEHAQAIQESIL
jgi:hypothetical protein